MRDASLDDGMFSVLVGGANTGVTNGGAIIAANAELRAEGGNVYALAGNTAGVIRATGVQAGQGKVWLVADGGTLDVAGTIAAQGASGGKGAIETSGRSVTIGAADIDAHGGTWLVDPTDLTIDATAATSIETALNMGTSVTEQTTATTTSGAGTTAGGPGDVIVAAPITWATASTLTLDAYHSVQVDAPITASNGGGLVLKTDDGETGGDLYFALGSSVQFTGTSAGAPTGSLTINAQAYTLVNSLSALSTAITANNSGFYALATSVDGSNGGSGYGASPLTSTAGTAFGGRWRDWAIRSTP